ncbi:arginine--tRNA ligase [Candidatus Chordibacter forsetii]|uniref:arginine--tRNA ligase n=1 Tax=Candidatus Chordibacter forsetii TaxID=3381758 RepID=UPI0038999DCF
MSISFDLINSLDNFVTKAAQSVDEFGQEFDPQTRSADERFGDFQANGVLPFAKKMGKNPRELAQKLIDALPASEDWSVKIAGPGFINFTLSPEYLLKWICTHGSTDNLKASAKDKENSKVVIDYSSPNTAKQMHVGHIRSTIIGESLARILAFQGNEILRDNHLGDWGTQFGILLFAIKEQGISLDDLGDDPIARLEDLYRQGNARIKEDENALVGARQELVKLQDGDEENLKLWEKIRDISMSSFLKIYDLLDVHFDHSLGESFYRDKVDGIYEELGKHKICQEDDGALVVFHPEHKRFAKQPFIIRKSDGASNYATTDLATLGYREKEWQAEQIIYVTDGRQRDHFEQLFLTAKKWFIAEERKLPTLAHVWFGTILGDDNKAIKTRDGQPVKLIDLLEEAIRRAADMVRQKNANLSDEEVQRRAKVIGLGAVKYADLSQDRTLDYVFSWDKMLAMQGNTAPYLQYAVARISSIFRKMERSSDGPFNEARPPQSDAERKLSRKLLFFPIALKQATRELKPHFLCTYLYELATDFSSFYNLEKVMVDDPEVRDLRLLLCSSTQSVLQTGLSLLGIETLEEM